MVPPGRTQPLGLSGISCECWYTILMNRIWIVLLTLLLLPACTSNIPPDPKDPIYQAKRLESRMEMWRQSQNLEAMLQMSRRPNSIDNPEMLKEVMAAREIWEDSVQEYAKKKEKEGELIELPQTMVTPEYASFSNEARQHYRAILKIYMERMEMWRQHEEFIRLEEERNDLHDPLFGRRPFRT